MITDVPQKEQVTMNATFQFIYIYRERERERERDLSINNITNCQRPSFSPKKKKKIVKGLVTELTSPPAQNAWGFLEEKWFKMQD